VQVLGYLSMSRPREDDLLLSEPGAKDDWLRLRHEPAMSVRNIVSLAEAAQARYGDFQDFKLKGGVLAGEQEVEALSRLHGAFPDARITLDPNGGWLLKDAIRCCAICHGVLELRNLRGRGAEGGLSAAEVMADFRRPPACPTATNMVATELAADGASNRA